MGQRGADDKVSGRAYDIDYYGEALWLLPKWRRNLETHRDREIYAPTQLYWQISGEAGSLQHQEKEVRSREGTSLDQEELIKRDEWSIYWFRLIQEGQDQLADNEFGGIYSSWQLRQERDALETDKADCSDWDQYASHQVSYQIKQVDS